MSQGFKLAPSRLNRGPPPPTEERKTLFPGLTASRLSVLAEPKLTPSTGIITSTNGGDREPIFKKPTTFSFTPLSKPNEESENKSESKEEGGEDDGSEVKVDSSQAASVFGENLIEKVTATPEEVTDDKCLEKVSSEEKDGADKKTGDEEAVEEASKNLVASSMLFSSAAAKASEDDNEKKTLSESAAEYTESHANKRKYDVVDVVTGEESESNMLKAQVKLYLFEKEKKNWNEKGRGVLRLNDDPVSTAGHLKSRLVMRTSGNMRVVLNTKLWDGMICEKANEKNVRISALDEGEVKVFLIACGIKDAEKIFTALEHRINQLKLNKDAGEEEEEDGAEDDAEAAKVAVENDQEESEEPPEKKLAPSE